MTKFLLLLAAFLGLSVFAPAQIINFEQGNTTVSGINSSGCIFGQAQAILDGVQGVWGYWQCPHQAIVIPGFVGAATTNFVQYENGCVLANFTSDISSGIASFHWCEGSEPQVFGSCLEDVFTIATHQLPDGITVGYCSMVPPKAQGFVTKPHSTEFVNYQYPGAVSTEIHTAYYNKAIGESLMAGSYFDGQKWHGFWYSAGQKNLYDAVVAGTGTAYTYDWRPGQGTWITGLNRSCAVGYYTNLNGIASGFLHCLDGDTPFKVDADTWPLLLNDDGTVTGKIDGKFYDGYKGFVWKGMASQ